jgi:hypothetical protein
VDLLVSRLVLMIVVVVIDVCCGVYVRGFDSCVGV